MFSDLIGFINPENGDGGGPELPSRKSGRIIDNGNRGNLAYEFDDSEWGTSRPNGVVGSESDDDNDEHDDVETPWTNYEVALTVAYDIALYSICALPSNPENADDEIPPPSAEELDQLDAENAERIIREYNYYVLGRGSLSLPPPLSPSSSGGTADGAPAVAAGEHIVAPSQSFIVKPNTTASRQQQRRQNQHTATPGLISIQRRLIETTGGGGGGEGPVSRMMTTTRHRSIKARQHQSLGAAVLSAALGGWKTTTTSAAAIPKSISSSKI